ncbi:acetyltransferase [Campylobacter sp. JMF_06 NA1]|uniref:acetyltransferase n=1 Tax=Campylobacter sp. JMF_06 NA1 TaxID=2983823 RepID=UPI0022E9FB88|nr:acetyltransferase [Campylobacter sp. JMF_06 NA1]MDA3077464.1 acetyltransferase [Campylobacter sp. JMF_06 NA1]
MEKTKLYIYGASGHGKVVADVAKSAGYKEIIFLDDNGELKFSPDLPKFPVIIAIGDCKIRANLQKKVSEAGFEIATLIHETAVISPTAKIGRGVVIMPNVVVNADAIIGDGVILNSACIIEHDCVIGEFSHISPNSALAGGVEVGEFSHIGLGSSVIQKVKIGKNCVIGAGSAVIKDIDENCVAVGVPAKIIKRFNI